MSVNEFRFIGNLTRDTELRYTGNGTAVATFDLAVDKQWQNSDGEKQEKTNYFRIKAWGKQAENAGKYLGKGSQIHVAGSIENTKFERGGETIYGQDFVASQIDYLNTKAPAGADKEG